MNVVSRWSGAIAFVVGAALMLASYLKATDEPWLLVLALAMLVAAWWCSPLRAGRHAAWSAVRERRSRNDVVVFWRPGCVYCLRLQASLGGLGRTATWINIWRDPDAAAFVRAHNDGNETVPTVIMAGKVVTNPEPDRVREALRRG